MIHFTCDMCGKPLLIEESVRYEVKIEVKAAYDPVELDQETFDKDYLEEIAELMDKLDEYEDSELQDEIYKIIKLDLCKSCQEQYIKDPLFKKHLRRFKTLDN